MKSFKRGSRGYSSTYTYSSVTPRREVGKWVWRVIIVAVVAFGVVLLYSMLSGYSPFEGFKLSYGDSLTEAEKAELAEIISKEDLESSLEISAETRNAPASGENEVTYDILLPTAEFADARVDVADFSDVNLTSIKELSAEQKVLGVGGEYFFDTYNSGAKFRVLTFTGRKVEKALEKVRRQVDLPSADTVLSINQTGVTALTRGMNDALLRQGGDATYFSREIKDFLSKTDFTHISNEVSFAEDCAVSSESTTLCSPVAMGEVLKAIDVDVVELTGNHNNDWGAEANLATIAQYKELGYQTFGGGENAETARQPLQISSKNTRITWLGYNQSTSTVANGQGASADYPGANIYDEEAAAADIAAAKARGDFVIVDVQYFECYSYPADGGEYPACDAPIDGQEELFRHLVDLGADMVVGTQAHQPQTYELYNGKPIYYGLGNLFFDQVYWPGTTRGYILTHYFYKGKLLQTRISPHQYDETYQTKLMNEEDAAWFLSRLGDAAPANQP